MITRSIIGLYRRSFFSFFIICVLSGFKKLWEYLYNEGSALNGSPYDVQQLFKRFSIFIYVGARIYDIELMTIELRKLYDNHLSDHETYMTACTS